MARRGGRGGPRGRGGRNYDERNGSRQTGPTHINASHSKGYNSFDRKPSGNPYKKINNLPSDDPFDRRNNNNKKGNRNAASAASSSGVSTSRTLNEMFRITVPQGQRFEREVIVSKIKEALEKDFAFYNYEKNTGNSTFYVVGRELAEDIKAMSRRVQLDNGFQLVFVVTRGKIEEVQINDEVKEVMKRTIARNYNPQTKVLSVANFFQNDELRNAGLFLPASKRNVLEEIVRIIVENIPDVVAINLSDNRIFSLEPLKDIVASCPNVKAIDVSKNSLAQKHELKVLSQLPLLELNVEGNPFCDRFKNMADVHSALQEYFPSLQKMDGDALGAKLSFGVTDAEVAKLIQALPPPVQYNIPEDVKPFVLNFVKQYFETFDAPDQRANISAVYAPTSVMTYSFSNLPKRNDGTGRSSHNLMRITDEALYNRYAHFGTDFIMRFFADFPQFKHEFETFSIDVPIVEGQTMMICINGQLTEVLKDDKPKLAFSRLWMLAYVDGKPIIQNDEYHLSSLSHVALDELKSKPKIDTTPAPAVFVPPVVQSLPQVQPVINPLAMPTVPIAMPQSITSSPAAPIAGVMGIGAPVTSQASNLETLMKLTKMVQPYAEKCLMEAGNDMAKAYEMFKNVHKQLPPEAFQQ